MQRILVLPRNPSRIIFLGDSITYQWHLEASFPGEAVPEQEGLVHKQRVEMLVRFSVRT